MTVLYVFLAFVAGGLVYVLGYRHGWDDSDRRLREGKR